MEEMNDTAEVLEVASIAGHILLENGAEISRVEDTMARISSHYGVDSGHFFVLSNGIFTTGSKGRYANVEFIPIRGIQLSKVAEVNKLSYDIAAGKYTLAQARSRLTLCAAVAIRVKAAQILVAPSSAAVSWIVPRHSWWVPFSMCSPCPSAAVTSPR